MPVFGHPESQSSEFKASPGYLSSWKPVMLMARYFEDKNNDNVKEGKGGKRG